MAEYIDREALIAFLEDVHEDADWIINQYNADWICSWIESQPAADVVEVVRCKDCVHVDIDDFDGSVWCCRDVERETVENHFCSYGEKR